MWRDRCTHNLWSISSISCIVVDIETLYNPKRLFINLLSSTCSTLIVDRGPPDRPIVGLGAGGGLLRAAVAKDGPRSASVAVVDLGKGLKMC